MPNRFDWSADDTQGRRYNMKTFNKGVLLGYIDLEDGVYKVYKLGDSGQYEYMDKRRDLNAARLILESSFDKK